MFFHFFIKHQVSNDKTVAFSECFFIDNLSKLNYLVTQCYLIQFLEKFEVHLSKSILGDHCSPLCQVRADTREQIQKKGI